MKIQKEELLSFMKAERERGRRVFEILDNMKISKTSYYRWKKQMGTMSVTPSQKRKTSRSVAPAELARVDHVKEQYPHLRHRQIQGLLQLEGHFLSASTVYNHLKSQNRVEPYARREAAWKEARYEPIGANIMWGADWTQIRIGGLRWYLLTLIDFFSRLIVHHDIQPTVNAGHIKRLYETGLANYNIPLDLEIKPELRLDQGSPNTARVTRDFFNDIRADLSFARVRRPTDNARTERFYRTIKQEEIYIVGDYQDEPTARETIGEYIKWYNEKRPHQALWNYTPWLVHETNDKTYMLRVLKQLKQKSWTERKEYWLEQKNKNPFDKKFESDKKFDN